MYQALTWIISFSLPTLRYCYHSHFIEWLIEVTQLLLSYPHLLKWLYPLTSPLTS